MTYRPVLRALVALGVALLPAACASGGSNSARQSAQAPRRSNTVISEEEIQRAHIPNVYELVSTLRPRWLQTRGVDSFQKPSQIQVYLGSTRMQGGVSSLQELNSLGVTKIEFVDGITASSRWGLDHGAGAIVVSMAAQRTP